jgi:hypothetical protein
MITWWGDNQSHLFSFAKAIIGSDSYGSRVRDSCTRGADVREVLRALTIFDVAGPATCCGRSTTPQTAWTGGRQPTAAG